MSGSGVEPAIGPAGKPCDFPKGLLGDGVAALLEQEYRNAAKPELARGGGERIERLLHGIPDEHQRLHPGSLGLAPRVRQDLADLGVAPPAVDPAHQLSQALAVRNPARRPALAESPVIDQLDVKSSDCRRLPEHLGLQPARGVPRRLPAHRCVQSEDETPAAAGLLGRPQRASALHEGLDLGAGCALDRIGPAPCRCRRIAGSVFGHRSKPYVSGRQKIVTAI